MAAAEEELNDEKVVRRHGLSGRAGGVTRGVGHLQSTYLRALLACAEPGRSYEGARKREGPNERAREGVRVTREAERGGDRYRCRYRCQVWKGVREAAARERSDGHMPPRGTSTEQSAARVLTLPAQSRYCHGERRRLGRVQPTSMQTERPLMWWGQLQQVLQAPLSVHLESRLVSRAPHGDGAACVTPQTRG